MVYKMIQKYNPKLTEKQRDNLNFSISGLLNGTYFEAIPLGRIEKIVEQVGGILLDDDCTPWAGLLCGEHGKAYFEIGKKSTKFVENDTSFYVPFKNSRLVLTWYKMPSTRYEVVAYIS